MRLAVAQGASLVVAGGGDGTVSAVAGALVGSAPAGTIWLNANEYPDGPCTDSLIAMSMVLAASGRYHYQEFPEYYSLVARSEQLEAGQVLVGAGSSEILHTAIDAFTSPTRPLILSEPTYEFPGELVRAAGHPVVGVPLPLICYGGTSMLTLLLGFGMLMSIETHKKLVKS